MSLKASGCYKKDLKTESLFCCSLLEATTDQIDNFILPLFLYPLVRFSSMAESDVIPGRLLDAWNIDFFKFRLFQFPVQKLL